MARRKTHAPPGPGQAVSRHRRGNPGLHGSRGGAQLPDMPELPDITVYLEALERRVVGQVLEKIRMENFFVLRTAVPPIDSLEKRRVVALRRIGKRIAFGFEGDRWLVLHLMIAGRL